jgi:hypothetical protein
MAVKEGIKKVNRIEYQTKEDLARYEDNLKLYNLKFVSSNKKLFDSYSLYVSSNLKLAEEAKKIDPSYKIINQNKTFNEVVSDVRSFGRLLSYPDCCVNEYIENVLKNKKIDECRAFKNFPTKINFLFNNQLNGSNQPNGLSNYCLSFHFPCSFNCQKNLEYLEKLFSFIKKNSPVLATSLKEYLKSPFLVFLDPTLSSLYVSWDKRQGFIFDGKVSQNNLSYSSATFFKAMYPEFQGENLDSDFLFIQKKIKEGDKIIFGEGGFNVYKGKNLLLSWKNKKNLRAYIFNFV